jgi:hypothetical protein
MPVHRLMYLVLSHAKIHKDSNPGQPTQKVKFSIYYPKSWMRSNKEFTMANSNKIKCLLKIRMIFEILGVIGSQNCVHPRESERVVKLQDVGLFWRSPGV